MYRLKPAFHDTDIDTDTDILAYTYILTKISVSWNAGLTTARRNAPKNCDMLFFPCIKSVKTQKIAMMMRTAVQLIAIRRHVPYQFKCV